MAEDAGRLINPMIADGQVHGGVAQGIGNALLEEIIYDETGNILTSTLGRLPAADLRARFPPIEFHHLETLSDASITKAKGRRRRRRDRRAGGGSQRHQRRAVAVRRIDRRDSGDAAAHPGGVAPGRKKRA